MRYHRFIGDFTFFDPHIKVYNKDVIRQMQNVLRLKIGDKVILSDGKTNEVLAQIEDSSRDCISGKVLEAWQNKNEPERDVFLYCSILKRENFELAAQKATEFGVKKVIPIVAQRTEKLLIKNNRVESIMREAAEQSGRGTVPGLQKVMPFDKAVESAVTNDMNVFFDLSGEDFDFSRIPKKIKKIGIFIGPEGGWSDQEVEMAKAKGFRIVNLGKLTLRAETAAIVSSYLMVQL